MVRLITKTYPSLADVYPNISVLNEETGENEQTWDYLNPRTIECNVTAINPQNSLEQFGLHYTKKVFLKIEFHDGSIGLTDQVGNLRHKNERHFYYGTAVKFYVFNVSGVSTQVDLLGNRVCNAGYIEYVTTLIL